MNWNRVGWYLLIIFYLAGGFNHFRDPEFYIPLIPPYLNHPEFINVTAGLAEIGGAVALYFKPTRKLGIFGLILMLIAFIPSHVYFIQIGGCIENGLCAPEWVGWVRLIIIHPLLILWLWRYRDYEG